MQGVHAVLIGTCLTVAACRPATERTNSRDPLTAFLASHADYHLLVRSDWIDKTEEKDATAPPQMRADTTGDGIPDLTAVVVRTAGGQRKFSVVSFTGMGPDTFGESPVWVVTDGDRALLGVASDVEMRAIIPLRCEACDSNEYYHWVGDAYEAGVYTVGALVFPNAESTTPIRLLATASDASQPIGELSPGVALHVLGYGPHYDAPHGPRRWHKVGGPINGRDLTGFVKAESLMDESEWHQYQELKGARR